MKLWLRFIQDDIVYDLRVHCVRYYGPDDAARIEREVEQFRTGRGMNGENLLNVYGRHVLTVSADETYSPTTERFIENFWICNIKFISLVQQESTPDDATYIPVQGNNEELAPVEYLRDNKHFKEWTFDLIEKYSRVWDNVKRVWKVITE